MRLPEELFLLAHDDAGRPAVHSASLDIGVAGGELTELALAGRIVAQRGRLFVVDGSPTDDPDSDALVAVIASGSEPPSLRTVLARVGEGAGGRIRDRLLADGVLTKVSHRRLGLMPVTRFPATDEAVRRAVSVRVWYAAHGRTRPDPPTAALCGLVLATLLHDQVFAAMPLQGLTARLQEIVDGQAPAVREIGSAVAALVTSRAVAIYR